VSPASPTPPAPPTSPTPTPPAEAALPGRWTAAEFETLAAVAETFVRGAARRRARLAIEAYEAAVDPSIVRQLRMVLRSFEQPIMNVALTGRAVRFRDLSPASRERYLLGWATSRLGQKRGAYQAFKRLLTFLAYADPGEDGRNPLLAQLGFPGTPEPVAAEATPIVPTRGTPDARSGVVDLEADVVVVGSGAAGGVVAADLARAGRSVVVLEAGPFVPEPEMPTDELAAFDRLYLNHGLTTSWDGAVVTLAGAGVGGGTLVNWLTTIDAPFATRRHWAREHGLEGIDGPEWDRDRDAITAELEAGAVPNVPPKDQLLLDGCHALGLEAATVIRNGVGCGDCGRCAFGCRRGAKRSGIQAHLADAWRHGARIVPDATVETVLRSGGRVTGVSGTVAVDGASHRLEVRAPQVVLAAGTLRTPLVLLRSGLRHPMTGRNLRLHPVAVIAARLERDSAMWRGTTQAARSLAFLGAGSDGSPDAPHGFVIESAPGTPGLIAMAFPWEGADPFNRLMGSIRCWVPLIGIVQDRGSGRVRWSRAGTPRIDYVVAKDDAAMLRRSLHEMARVARAGGAQELIAVGTPPAWYGRTPLRPNAQAPAFRAFEQELERFSFAPNRGTVLSAHQMGTVRAGGDGRRHVCDPRGRVRVASGHDDVERGLYVADASLFPTALGTNPMLTTMTMARRVARTVLAEG
jgi:choline dehydrogenase-like flavoprotein